MPRDRIFNTGSPYNVPAGHGPINLDKVLEKYWKDSEDMEKKKLVRLEKKRNAGRPTDPAGNPEEAEKPKVTPVV